MSEMLVALILLAVLISAVQFAWVAVAGRLDPALLPPAARHRVAWLASHSTRVQVTLLVVAAAAAAARLAH